MVAGERGNYGWTECSSGVHRATGVIGQPPVNEVGLERSMYIVETYSCPAKSVSPIPTGAKGVARCFSAANIRTTRHRPAVASISMNNP
jgi:hypothetical protein